MLRIKNKEISNINISGRGGAERMLSEMFENEFVRINDPLFDVRDANDGKLYEFKKQKDLQWFDVGKYFDLSPEQREIMMTFVTYKEESPDMVVQQTLGSFVDTCCSDPDFQKDGWTHENIKAGALNKKLYPKMQFKVPLKTRRYFKKYADKVNVIYSRKK